MFDSSNSNNEDNINVLIRIRPRENNSSSTLLNIFVNKIITSNKSYQSDYIADENSTQNDIFENCAKKICDYCLEGYNGTILAYGQTGSGKTYTLFGPKFFLNNMNNYEEIINTNENNNYYNFDIKDESIGLLPRIIYYLFNKTKNNSYTFRISYFEIYQENLNDLLNPEYKDLIIYNTENKNNEKIKGLRKFLFNSPEEGLKYIIQGSKLRKIASTKMNDESSRSHAVITIYIENSIEEDGIKLKKNRKFHIIDLAGSERQKKTESTGERVIEAGSINKSLLNLRKVINNIINNIKPIPYRDTKLTFFLKDSLGGNSKTSIIGNVSPSDSNNPETISTLEFAICAKKVKNKAIINEELSNINILEFKKLKDKNKKLYQENNMLKQQINNNLINEMSLFDYTSMIESAENDIEKMSKEMELKDLEIEENKYEINKLNDKIQKYEIEIILKDNNNYLLNEENKKIKIENIKLLEDYNKLKNTLFEIQKIFDEESSILNNNLNIDKEKINDNELLFLLENINLYKKNCVDLINEKNLEINNLKLEYENLKNEFTKLEKERNNEKKNYNYILKENENFKIEIKNIKDEYNKLTQKYENEIKKFHKNEENLKENLNNYNNGLKDVKNLINNLNNSDLENQIKLYQNEKNSSFNSLNILEKEIKELNDAKQKLKTTREKFKEFSYLDNNNISNQEKNISIIFKVNDEFFETTDILVKKFDDFTKILNNKEKGLKNNKEMLLKIIDKIDEVLKNKYENLNEINIKKSNKKNNFKFRKSLVLHKRNYDEFKSANKENLNSSNILNTLKFFSESKKMKNKLLNFNINYFYQNEFNYNIINNNDSNIISNDNDNSIESSNFHILK